MRTPSCITFCLSMVLAFAAHGQSTAFNYQGDLTQDGASPTGAFDMRFRLFDAASGGTQVGSTTCVNNVQVTGGKFTTTIDFGQQFAQPSPRYLELIVRPDAGQPCTDDSGYVTLVPRQPITATPIATHAASAFSLSAPDGSPTHAVAVSNDGKVGIGTTTPGAVVSTTQLDVFGGSMLVAHSGDQADLLWLASERSWVFRQEGTGASAALKLQSIGGGGNKNFVIQTDGLVGIGTTAPAAKLDVRGDIRLGVSGQYRAAAGTENLRIVRGSVTAAGTANFGSGFTVTRPSTGVYIITFTQPFTGVPSISVTPELADVVKLAMTNGVTSSTARIEVSLRSDGSFSNCEFGFIAIGPRV
ncbi:MAG TPA: hypothetical protein VHN77_10195 [Phycisphaerales bacterium]|nr:hypothetical protein [Phycisphaerales bacterium]